MKRIFIGFVLGAAFMTWFTSCSSPMPTNSTDDDQALEHCTKVVYVERCVWTGWPLQRVCWQHPVRVRCGSYQGGGHGGIRDNGGNPKIDTTGCDSL